MGERPGSEAQRPAVPSLALCHDGPALIAHGAGNSRSLTRSALAEHPDYLEVDLWVHADRFEARHERAAYPLPFLVEKWYLRPMPRPIYSLTNLLIEAGPSAGILLDLKNGSQRAAGLVRRALDAAPGHARVTASAQHWRLLREVRAACPEVDCFYSIDVPAKLDLFLSVADRDLIPLGVSCRHTLLTRELVRELHARGLAVVAWTIDDPNRAQELLSWGVDGITTECVSEIRAALKLPLPGK